MATVLRSYFVVVETLREYLSQILESSETPSFIPTDEDSELYRELVNNAYVGTAAKPGGVFQVGPPITDMKEIIGQSILRLLGKAPNDDGRGKANPVTNDFVNTIVTALQAPEWDTLLRRIGLDAMIHLLTETSVFVALPNGCLCQMTGYPIHLRRPSKTNISSVPSRGKKRRWLKEPASERPTKRLRLVGVYPSSKSAVTTISPADIYLPRHLIFYSKPKFISHSARMIVGLHPQHILNKLCPEKPIEYDPNNVNAQMDKARRLAKHIFPRQYGLSTRFFQHSNGATWKQSENFDRDQEIQMLGPCKTPKRLKSVLNMLEKMIWRHSKCRYEIVRNTVCPSKIVTNDRSAKLDEEVILARQFFCFIESANVHQELMSENSIQLKSQASVEDTFLDSQGNQIPAQGLTQAERYAKSKPRFADYCCSQSEVTRYVLVITKTVIPDAFWGSQENFRLIAKTVKKIVVSRRFETLSLHNVIQGFSTSACDWLMPPGLGEKQMRVPVTDFLKRRELLEDFLYWYFDSFVLSLLKTTFYITDSSAFRRRMLYFRHDDWKELCNPLIRRLTETTFQRMPESHAEALLRQRKLGYSFVRLLPKETGVRPIVNLRRKKTAKEATTSGKAISINQVLQAAFSILTYEKQTKSLCLGASVFGPDDVYNKLKTFKSNLSVSSSGNLPKLYFVKVDVQACFDTIDQTKLLEILRVIISEDAYMIRRYGHVSMKLGDVKRQYCRKAVPDDEHTCFLQYARELASILRHTIFVDQVRYPTEKRQEILHLLEGHITENIVKIGNDYYRQMVGIPQGSVLSTILCSFFYGDLEKRFGDFTDHHDSTMLRSVDDYLFITTSLPKARKFLDMMNTGHPDYGCFISKDKTMTNFDYDEQIMNVTEPQQKCFAWCGYNINMEDLSVSVDYSRYRGAHLADSLSVNCGRQPGAAFQAKMLLLAKSRSHAIYSDSVLNSSHVVYLNIYQNFIICAMKMHSYICNWNIRVGKNTKFIERTMDKMLLYTYAAIRRGGKANHARVEVKKREVIWLGMHAFHVVFSRKPCRYTQLLKRLFTRLKDDRHRYGTRFRRVFKDGLKPLADIGF